MSDNLDARPDEFRRIAEQHDAVAAILRKAKVPQEYLDAFLRRNGTFHAPTHAYLIDSYTGLIPDAHGQATSHERAGDHLRDAASKIEEADVLQIPPGHDVTASQKDA
ncbi:hypothetical protein [Nocardia heshunensis]